MLDHPNTLDSILDSLPREDGTEDIGIATYDPDIIPYLVALVAKKKLRAVFVKETDEQLTERTASIKQTCTPEFWQYMHARNSTFSSRPFDVNTDPEQAFKSPLMDQQMLPPLLSHEMKLQANILADSFSKFTTADALIFTSHDDFGGTFPMHQDGNLVTLHKTLSGKNGMTYMRAPISKSYEAMSHNQAQFAELIADNPDLTAKIPTGVMSIFGREFYHASSGVQSVSVGSVLGITCDASSIKYG